jgi:hypothetical protein
VRFLKDQIDYQQAFMPMATPNGGDIIVND